MNRNFLIKALLYIFVACSCGLFFLFFCALCIGNYNNHIPIKKLVSEDTQLVRFEIKLNAEIQPIIATPETDFTPKPRKNKQERRYLPIILKAANHHNMDPALIQAVIKAESSYNPRAVSPKGARGLMQLMPETAKQLGVKNSFNPEQNIFGGVRYLKQLLNEFEGDTILAVAAYNAGSEPVKQYKGVPPYKETRGYVKKVFKYYKQYKKMAAIFQNPGKV